MPCWISMYLFVLAMINDCETFLPAGMNSSTKALIASKLGSSETETVLDFRENDTVQCLCVEQFCPPFCCPTGSLKTAPGVHNCSSVTNRSALDLPDHYEPWVMEARSGHLQIHDFHVCLWKPYQGGIMDQGKLKECVDDKYKLLANGSINLPVAGKMINFTNYCYGAVNGTSVYRIILCEPIVFENYSDDEFKLTSSMFVACLALAILSFSSLLGTFVVYTVIPELRNMHGATLRGYVGQLIFTEILIVIALLRSQYSMNSTMCISYAFVIHFSGLAVFFWLNVMCFDIWWTFGGPCLIQGSVRQWRRKKFMIYSAYAWGSSFLIAVGSLTMDLVPSVPRTFIRPEFGVRGCWFHTKVAGAIYHYGPMSMTVICNMCLFASTTMMMKRHKKETAQHLKETNSRRHEDNKQRLHIHLRLFIVMGIHWSLEIINWLCNDSSMYLWFTATVTNSLQSVIIFIILVCKDRIKRLLLKRQGYQNRSTINVIIALLQGKSNSNLPKVSRTT